MSQHCGCSMRRQPLYLCIFFFFNDTATTEIYTLSLHDALPIWPELAGDADVGTEDPHVSYSPLRSEEHTSELQSHSDLVCRLLLEKKTPDSVGRLTDSLAPARSSRTARER